jgi:hypothetical protein
VLLSIAYGKRTEKEGTLMDVLVIFMIFASIAPFLFWRWQMQVVGLIQLPFIVGMWVYFVNVIMPVNGQPEYLSFWLVLFIGNLVFGELALIKSLIQLGKRVELKRIEAREKGFETLD